MYLNIFNGVLNEKLLDKTNADEVFNKEVIDNLSNAFSDFKPTFAIVKTEADFDNFLMCDQLKYVEDETITRKVNNVIYTIGNYEKTFFIMVEKDKDTYILKSSKNKIELTKRNGSDIVSKLCLDKSGNVMTFGKDFYLKEMEQTK